jgi:hypothetical protein
MEVQLGTTCNLWEGSSLSATYAGEEVIFAWGANTIDARLLSGNLIFGLSCRNIFSWVADLYIAIIRCT